MNEQNNDIFNKPYFFPNLNSLRFICAFLLFLFHNMTFTKNIWGDFYSNTYFTLFLSLLNKVLFSVNFFFVVSGFLITYLLLHEKFRTKKVKIGNFLMRRILRIWPLYFILVVFGFFIFPYLPNGIQTVHELWRFSIFLSNIDEIIVGMNDPLNFLTVSWTISVEEHFYFIWALFFMGINFLKNKLSIMQLTLLFNSCLFLFSIIYRINHNDSERILYYHTFSVLGDLAIGSITALAVFKPQIIIYFKNLSRLKIIFFYLFSIIYFIGEGFVWKGNLIAFNRIIPSIIFGILILEQVYSLNSPFKVDQIPYINKAGKLTYGFYMFHSIFIYYWAIYFENHQLTSSILYLFLFIGITFTSTYFCSYISYYYFEEKILKLKKYFK
ncbi:MAG: acyltransferase [Flavobacteriia bacterium]|nr:acyltransferase [Flavobacteriia bacterium]